MNAIIQLKGNEEPIIHTSVTNISKKEFHIIVFTADWTYVYELDKVERIEVTV